MRIQANFLLKDATGFGGVLGQRRMRIAANGPWRGEELLTEGSFEFRIPLEIAKRIAGAGERSFLA
jgi:hypothetical protein